MHQLQCEGFRNLQPLRLHPHPRLNVLVGPNGAGKTSLLEAIYFLSRVRSFRTRTLDRIVGWQARQARVIALRGEDRLAVARSPGTTALRLNGRDAPSRSELTSRLPVQLINTEHQRLLLDGPRVRRQFLDWGAFHVEPGYRDSALRYQHALRQRNAALRHGDLRQGRAWLQPLAEAASQVDQARAAFVSALTPIWEELVQHWLAQPDLELRYDPGAAADGEWLAHFQRTMERDQQLGHTRTGPHRADLQLQKGRIPAVDALSRGQQKLLVLALLVAEIALWAKRGLRPVLLIDDLAAELDAEHLALVLHTLCEQDAQLFLTAIDPGWVPLQQRAAHWYRLQAGEAAPMV